MLAGNIPAQQTPSAPSTSSGTAKTSSSTSTTHKSTTTAKKTAPAPLVLTTPKQKASYAIGETIGKQMHEEGVELDPAIFYRAWKDALAGKPSQMTDDEMHATLKDFQEEMHKEILAKNLKQGEDFRAANKTKPGVVTLPDGLQYKVIVQGTGPKPTAQDSVVCNYEGRFVDGKVFDSSYKRGQPATFPVTGVIKGWTEILQMMPVGSKWQIVVPPELAYGAEGRRGGMPPNETLVFDVELMKIAEKPPAAPVPQTQPSAPAQPPASGPPSQPKQ